MRKVILVRDNVRRGIRPLKESFTDADIWGCDFETVNGIPYTIQIKHGGGEVFHYLKKPGHGFDRFLDAVQDRGEKNVRCYFWCLFYDLPCLLFRGMKYFQYRDFKIKTRYRGKNATISASVDKSWFAHLKWGRYSVRILDAFQFFRTKLDKAGRELLNVRKLKTPAGLGERRLRSKEFKKYAMHDARLTYRLGEIIERFHDLQDINYTVSASQFAAKVFRKHHLKKTIPYPPKKVEKAGLLSYHGGLNWVTPDAPGFWKGVNEYDITSAYPESFLQFPNFCDNSGKWVTTGKRPGKHGFVKVRFKGQCKYYGVRGHGFEQIEGGTVWITTYEWRSCRTCLRNAEVLESYSFKGARGPSPFAAHMLTFFREKTRATSPAATAFAKLCLNGISGKLVQNKEQPNGTFVAGGLFNPALASLVTGFTRARLHALLHELDGLHCATDSVFTTRSDVPETTGIGGLERKSTGDLLLLRNKLYLFLEPGTEKIIKWGLHGFWGKPEDLRRLWKERGSKYEIKRIFRVKEALLGRRLKDGRKAVPLKMEEGIERELKICWDNFREEYCGQNQD